jgi:uncharacterized protein YndB with AHSA1/START domain
MTTESTGAIARIVHTFNASPERVFDAWLDPAKIASWMLIGGGTFVSLAVDARVGGRFSFVVERDGAVLDHTGEYLEIQRPTKLAFTWGVASGDEPAGTSRVDITITAAGGGCELVLVHELGTGWEEWVEQATQGWTMIISEIEKTLV